MIRRLIWLLIGAALGVWAFRRLQRTVRKFTPTGLSERAQGAGASAKSLVDDVRRRFREREAELREALGLVEAYPLPENQATRPAGLPDNG
jgi:hypothetical protein